MFTCGMFLQNYTTYTNNTSSLIKLLIDSCVRRGKKKKIRNRFSSLDTHHRTSWETSDKNEIARSRGHYQTECVAHGNASRRINPPRLLILYEG